MRRDRAGKLIDSLHDLPPRERADLCDWLGIRPRTLQELQEIEARMALSLRLRSMTTGERPN